VYRFASAAAVTSITRAADGPPLFPGGPAEWRATATFTALDPAPAWRHAGGVEDWVVACPACGTTDDDGARMVACDACGAWVHTRCLGVADGEPVPAHMLCAACVGAVL
jgi:hypothetical protein